MSRRKLSEILKTMIAAMFFIVLMLIYGQVDAGEIHIRADAEAAGSIMKVGDVADLTGFDEADTKKIAETSLGAAPGARSVRTLTKKEIELRLKHRGFDMDELVLRGAEKVEVRRGTSSGALDDSPIRREVKNYLRKNLGGRIRITILDVDTGPVAGRAGSIYPCQGKPVTASVGMDEIAGGEPVFVFVPVKDARDEDARLAVEVLVTRMQTVIRAAGNIHRGQRLTAEDLTVDEAPEDSVFGRPLTREEILGAKTSRRIKEGEILSEGDVVLPPVIRKGDKISVVVQRGMLEVTTTATALEDGSVGSTIRVENSSSKGTYRVTVCGTGKARKE